MHVGAVALGATPLTAGAAGIALSGTATIALTTSSALYVPSEAVLWYRSTNIEIEVEYADIAIDVTPNIGVITE